MSELGGCDCCTGLHRSFLETWRPGYPAHARQGPRFAGPAFIWNLWHALLACRGVSASLGPRLRPAAHGSAGWQRPPTILRLLGGARRPLRISPLPRSAGMASSRVLEPTAEEQALFETLLAAAAQAGFPTTLRCAGGWVRDKLLGRASADIDVALDDALGSAFAAAVNEHLAGRGQATGSVAVIAANPAQSKHLETARVRVHGAWLDLVNLRSESYASDSRIPAAEFGTPLQDAQRRDFTVNALFYNLHTRAVEDFTGLGLADLRAGLLRTPLPPRQTLLDDPLRALRGVRFAARLGFRLDDDLIRAAAQPEVRAAVLRRQGFRACWGVGGLRLLESA